MKKRQAYAAAALLLAIFAVRADVFGGTIFWKAASPTATVYLLGSIHMATPAVYPLSASIERAFAGADFLVVEANALDAAADPGMVMNLIQEKGYNPEGRSLRDELPGDLFAAFSDACARYGLDPTNFGAMRPWLAAVNFGQTVLTQSGFDPASGIDMHFLSEASGNKEVLELESISFQFGLFADLDRELQAEFLRQTLAENGQMKESVDRMLDCWRRGDGEQLAAIATASFDTKDPRAALLYRKLVTDRNYGMAAKIESYLRTAKTYFVVVGAGHLPGKEGIIELLRKKGFRLTTPEL